jgi:hypothetical protein
MAEPNYDERCAELDRALAKTQQEERVELKSDLDRVRDTDERIVDALAGDEARPDDRQTSTYQTSTYQTST